MGDVPASTTPQQQDARTLAQHSSATPRVAVAHTCLPFYYGLLGIEPQQPDATARSKRQRRPRAPPVQLPRLLLQLPPHTTPLQHTYQLQTPEARDQGLSPRLHRKPLPIDTRPGRAPPRRGPHPPHLAARSHTPPGGGCACRPPSRSVAADRTWRAALSGSISNPGLTSRKNNDSDG